MREIGIFPPLFDVRDKTRHIDKIEWAIADDLITNAVVIAFRITRCRSRRPHSAGIIGSPFSERLIELVGSSDPVAIQQFHGLQRSG